MTQIEIERAIESIWTLFRETDRRFGATEREIEALSDQTRAGREPVYQPMGPVARGPGKSRGWSSCSKPGGSRSTAVWNGHGYARAEKRWRSICCW